MILSTSERLQDREIKEYIGLVFGESVNGINFIKDFGASIRNIVGGRSVGYEEEIVKMRSECLEEMATRADELGADAVIGIQFDFESLGPNGGIIMLNVSGTAVKLK